MRPQKTHVVASLGLPEANVLTGKADNVTLVVHDTGTGTAGTDIDANVVVLNRVELVVRINRHLSRLLSRSLPVWLAEWHRSHGECDCFDQRSSSVGIELNFEKCCELCFECLYSMDWYQLSVKARKRVGEEQDKLLIDERTGKDEGVALILGSLGMSILMTLEWRKRGDSGKLVLAAGCFGRQAGDAWLNAPFSSVHLHLPS